MKLILKTQKRFTLHFKHYLNSNKFKLSFKSAGFTLIEVLTSIAVIMVVGALVSSILFSSIRGTTKTNTITAVRQNGYNTISQMVKTLRNAKKIETPSSCIVPPAPTPEPSFSSITFSSFDGGQTTFACCSETDNFPATIASNSGSLTCTSNNRISFLETSSVKLVSCSFKCTQDSVLDFPKITIDFSLKEANPDGFTLFSEKTTTAIPFQTSVILRN